jgi:hypothetical protein
MFLFIHNSVIDLFSFVLDLKDSDKFSVQHAHAGCSVWTTNFDSRFLCTIHIG